MLLRARGSARWLLILTMLCLGGVSVLFSCSRPAVDGTISTKNQALNPSILSAPIPLVRPVVTFIELGSVNCIPCRAMQPILEEIRNRYGSQVKVVFYDVWTKEGQPYGQKYRIRVIPTQVFLDREGKEFFRHEGFFPAEELLKVLEQGGVRL